MFRYERPQKGRSRQFHQSSVEVFGMDGPEIDAEIILLSSRLWKALGIDRDLYLEINSLGSEETRQDYIEALVKFFKPLEGRLDEDSKRKLEENPLRILDSKSENIINLLQEAPKITDFLDEDSALHFKSLLNLLDDSGVEYTINSNLVRGLDYYNKTVFEWKTKNLGSQDTVCGGGRYDSLVEELGGKPCPAIGFSMGMERLILLIQDSLQKDIITDQSLDCFFICFGKTSINRALLYAEEIRNTYPDLNLKVNFGSESASSQFKKADKSGARFALILGETEIEEDKITYKDLRKRSEQETTDFRNILEKLNNYIQEG